MKRIVAIFLVSILIAACSTVPITGRSRIAPVDDDQVLPASFAQYKGFLEKMKNQRMKKKVLR